MSTIRQLEPGFFFFSLFPFLQILRTLTSIYCNENRATDPGSGAAFWIRRLNDANLPFPICEGKDHVHGYFRCRLMACIAAVACAPSRKLQFSCEGISFSNLSVDLESGK